MILKKIIEDKRMEVEKRKAVLPLKRIFSKIKGGTDKAADFKKAISKKGLNLIAEIKKSSPREGLIRKDFDFLKILKIYDKNKNVAAISILTDKKYFQGDINYIRAAKKLTQKPILRKDFIIDKYQIYESAYYGADAILLIAAILSKKQIDEFIDLAKSYNIACLVEVHTEGELKKVLKTKAGIIGINNRNLKNFKIDLNTTINLSKLIAKDKIIVSESGLNTREDIERIKPHVDAALIGTSIMKSRDINEKIDDFLIK